MLNGDIEQASRIDIGAIADLLAEGLMDDPSFVWMVPDPATRARCLQPFARAMVRATLSHGVVLHRIDNLAASLWRRPGQVPPGRLEIMRSLPAVFPLFKAGGARVRAMNAAVLEHYPDFTFRYLQFVAVEKTYRGKGIGSAILREGLERAAVAGEPVYVETAKPENIGFYRHHGFDVIDEWTVATDGPVFTSLLKRP